MSIHALYYLKYAVLAFTQNAPQRPFSPVDTLNISRNIATAQRLFAELPLSCLHTFGEQYALSRPNIPPAFGYTCKSTAGDTRYPACLNAGAVTKTYARYFWELAPAILYLSAPSLLVVPSECRCYPAEWLRDTYRLILKTATCTHIRPLWSAPITCLSCHTWTATTAPALPALPTPAARWFLDNG